MSDIVEEIRQAYGRVGITLDRPATYGTYYRLLCGGCGKMVGNVGDRLLPAGRFNRSRTLGFEGGHGYRIR